MLVLSRKERQTILVGDDIEITICRVSGRRVTIGLSAPQDICIRRGEMHTDDEPPSWSGQAGLLARLPGARRSHREMTLRQELTVE